MISIIQIQILAFSDTITLSISSFNCIILPIFTASKSIQILNEENEPVYKSLFAVDEGTQTYHDVDTIPVKLSKMKLSKPRAVGDCWLGCEIWDQLGLDTFWSERIDSGKQDGAEVQPRPCFFMQIKAQTQANLMP